MQAEEAERAAIRRREMARKAQNTAAEKMKEAKQLKMQTSRKRKDVEELEGRVEEHRKHATEACARASDHKDHTQEVEQHCMEADAEVARTSKLVEEREQEMEHLGVQLRRLREEVDDARKQFEARKVSDLSENGRKAVVREQLVVQQLEELLSTEENRMEKLQTLLPELQEEAEDKKRFASDVVSNPHRLQRAIVEWSETPLCQWHGVV